MIIKNHLKKLLKYKLFKYFFTKFYSKQVSIDDIKLDEVKKTISKVLDKCKSKEKLKVCFIVTTESKWKYHLVYETLKLESWVESASIVVVQNTYIKNSLKKDEFNRAVTWFENNGYEVLNPRVAGYATEVNIQKELKPDIIFYSDPYSFVGKSYDIARLYKNSLCCYSQYSFMILNAYESFYNLPFHNLLWCFFSETQFHKKLSEIHAKNEGTNVVVTGYPYSDVLHSARNTKPKSSRKKIIWAPHHTISQDQNQQSNFIALSRVMKSISASYPLIDFVFKPHPNLFNRLCESSLPEWGEDKAIIYYDWWRGQKNTSIQEGEYTELFLSSDALIHDSASFTLEYMLTGKPALFNLNKSINEYDLNDLGKAALATSYLGHKEKDIVEFIENVVINGNDPMIDIRIDFTKNNLNVSKKELASQKIVEHLRFALCK